MEIVKKNYQQHLLSTGQACQEDRDFLYCVTLAAAAVSELYGFSQKPG